MLSQRHRSAHGLIVWSVAFVLLWNSGFIGAEFGLPYSGPFTMLFWRYLALTLVTWPIAAVRGQLRKLPLRDTVRIAVVGVLSHGVWLSCVLLAIDRGVPAGIVSLVVALQPLLTGALSGMVTGERTNPRQWVGLALGFAGVAVAVGGRLEGSTPAPELFYLLPFVSAAAITTANLIQRRSGIIGTGERIPVTYQLAIQATATTVVLLPAALFVESLATDWVPTYWGSMIWLVLAVSLGAYALMWRLLERSSATRIASLFYLGPPVTMLMAWAAFGDTLVASDLIGLAVAGSGVLLVTLRTARSCS